MNKLIMGLMCAGAACAASAEVCVKDGDTVAFMGDSITQLGNKPAGYVNLVMKGLEAVGVKDAKKLPAGISGQRSTHMNARLDKDVLVKRPQWMTFSCGVNDVWHGKGGVPLDQYKKLVADIFDRCAASNVNVVVLTPTVIGEDLTNAENVKLTGYVAWLKEEAARRNLRIADLNADFHAELKRIRAAEPGRKGNLLTCDGVHMAFPGDCIMAWGVLRAMGVEPSQKDKVFTAFRQVSGAYSVSVSFTADEWADYQRRCKEAHRADYIYARDLLIGPPKVK